LRSGLVTAGCLVVDRVKRIDRWPEEETVARVVGEERQGGGSTFNAAVDCRRLGAPFPVEAAGLLGADADGDFLVAALSAQGVGTARIRRTQEAPTSYSEVMTSMATGKRTFFYREGANALIGVDDIDVSGSSARFAHFGLPGLHAALDAADGAGGNGWVAALRRARSAGLETSLELVSVEKERIAAIVRPCLPHLDLLVVNAYEAGALSGLGTGSDGADPAGAEAAAEAALAAGAMRLVVVHFPEGAVAVARDGAALALPSVAVPEGAIEGAVGAGDAFASGLLLALHEGWGLEEGMRLAHAAAAASLRALDAVSGVEDWRACLALATRWGWRDALIAGRMA